ncbi:MAG: YcxB family protein [Sulfurovum sp.]|nr:YcxB family protein [Sulfurovum sp.]
MQLSYQLSLNQYQEAVNVHYKTGKRPLFVALFLTLATFTMLVGTDFSQTQEVVNNILITFFALSFYILFTRMITSYQAKKIYDKSPLLSYETSLRISGKGIKQDKNHKSNTLPWSLFTSWKQNEHYYLLYTNSHQFNVIPKSAIEAKQQEELEAYFIKYID